MFKRFLSYEYLQVSTKGRVGVVILNRPKSLNALSSPFFTEINACLAKLDASKEIGAIVLTGSEKAFAAGADIKEMADLTFANTYTRGYPDWDLEIRKPIIAAVNGFALGGGCELAMMCDVIFCGETAKFGQPEVKLGVPPGAGGTQRLVRAVGKSKAMEMVLSGDMISAEEALKFGLVSRVVKDDLLVDEATKFAEKVSGYSQIAIQMIKELVNKSFEVTLQEGLSIERRLFQASFSTKDQKEGMKAFVGKRVPVFTNE